MNHNSIDYYQTFVLLFYQSKSLKNISKQVNKICIIFIYKSYLYST